MSHVSRPARILDPGDCLTLRPMVYPEFFEMYRAAIKNTWTVEEVDFSMDVGDLQKKMTDAERHLVQRLVAFFRTRGTEDVEEFQVVQEDVRFMLPKTIRQALAGQAA